LFHISGVTTYCLHPGSVRTELLRNIPVYVRVPMQLLGLLFFKVLFTTNMSIFVTFTDLCLM